LEATDRDACYPAPEGDANDPEIEAQQKKIEVIRITTGEEERRLQTLEFQATLPTPPLLELWRLLRVHFVLPR
jgi:hypothetical protein